MFTQGDISKIQNLIECTQLELDTWDFLSPTQRQTLKNKIRQLQDQLAQVRSYLEGNP